MLPHHITRLLGMEWRRVQVGWENVFGSQAIADRAIAFKRLIAPGLLLAGSLFLASQLGTAARALGGRGPVGAASAAIGFMYLFWLVLAGDSFRRRILARQEGWGERYEEWLIASGVPYPQVASLGLVRSLATFVPWLWLPAYGVATVGGGVRGAAIVAGLFLALCAVLIGDSVGSYARHWGSASRAAIIVPSVVLWGLVVRALLAMASQRGEAPLAFDIAARWLLGPSTLMLGSVLFSIALAFVLSLAAVAARTYSLAADARALKPAMVVADGDTATSIDAPSLAFRRGPVLTLAIRELRVLARWARTEPGAVVAVVILGLLPGIIVGAWDAMLSQPMVVFVGGWLVSFPVLVFVEVLNSGKPQALRAFVWSAIEQPRLISGVAICAGWIVTVAFAGCLGAASALLFGSARTLAPIVLVVSFCGLIGIVFSVLFDTMAQFARLPSLVVRVVRAIGGMVGVWGPILLFLEYGSNATLGLSIVFLAMLAMKATFELEARLEFPGGGERE